MILGLKSVQIQCVKVHVRIEIISKTDNTKTYNMSTLPPSIKRHQILARPAYCYDWSTFYTNCHQHCNHCYLFKTVRLKINDSENAHR